MHFSDRPFPPPTKTRTKNSSIKLFVIYKLFFNKILYSIWIHLIITTDRSWNHVLPDA